MSRLCHNIRREIIYISEMPLMQVNIFPEFLSCPMPLHNYINDQVRGIKRQVDGGPTTDQCISERRLL